MMKAMETINDLKHVLGMSKDYGEFWIEKTEDGNFLLRNRKDNWDVFSLVEFTKRKPYWHICKGFSEVEYNLQQDIWDFIYDTDSRHWFDKVPEKRYNIIISQNPDLDAAVAYFKRNKYLDLVGINYNATSDDLKTEKYQFTDDEIAIFKEIENGTFRQFADVGKVEVKDEKDEDDLKILTEAIEKNKDEKRYSLDDVKKELGDNE